MCVQYTIHELKDEPLENSTAKEKDTANNVDENKIILLTKSSSKNWRKRK